MQILLTGFEPFGGSNLNPSQEAVLALDGQTIGGARIVTAILPVDWQKGPEALLAALEAHVPDAVLCLGEAPRPVISVERVAINLLDFRIPDNSGVTVTDQPVVPGGPAAYFVTLPDRALCGAIQAAGVPAELSLSAGSYLCNAILYHLLHFLARKELHVPAGFIHLPQLPQQAAESGERASSMSLDTILAGLRPAVETLAQSILSTPIAPPLLS